MRIPVFGLGQASRSPYVTAKGIQNMYCEQRPMGEKSSMVAYRTPGLTVFADSGVMAPPRGAWTVDRDDTSYVVISNVFYQITNAGNLINLATLNTSVGRVSIADNGNQLMIVDGVYGYIYSKVALTGTPQTITSITRSGTTATLTTATPHGLTTGNIAVITGNTPAAYNGTFTVTVTGASTFTYEMESDPGGVATIIGSYTLTTFAVIASSAFPSEPRTVTFLAGYFVISLNQSSRFYVSGFYDGLFWDALAFANAESSADPIVAVWSSSGQLILMGSRTMEFWGLSGALDFPFSQIQGSSTEWGLAATWSVSKYDNSVACLIRNRMGQVMVAKLSGYLPQKISTPDIDYIINNYARIDDATSYSYMLGGHPMFVISFPSAGYSWLYDGSTGIWSSLKSYQSTRHIGEFGWNYLQNNLVADFEDGIIYKIDPLVFTENGSPIESEIISETVVSPDLERFSIDKFRVDMEVGNAAPGYSNPVCSLQVSRDNGKTYGAEMFKEIGPVGNYRNAIEWTRLGGGNRNYVFKIRVVDPVQFTLVNGMVNPND